MRLKIPQREKEGNVPVIWERDPVNVFEALCAVWREQQPARINGYLVSVYLAGLTLRVYSGMMPRTRERFIDRPLPQMIAIALEIVG